MIDPVSVTFNKSTNNYNIPFAIIQPKKKNGDGRSPSKLKMDRLPLNNNDNPYSNVIGKQQQALFTQDNILNFKKELDEFADFSYEKIKRERLKKQEYYEAEALEPEAGPSSSMIKRKAGDEDDKSSSKIELKKTKKLLNLSINIKIYILKQLLKI